MTDPPAANDGDELDYHDYFDPFAARGRYWPHAIKTLVQTPSSESAHNVPAVFVCGEKPGMMDSKNYFILCYTPWLTVEIPGSRPTGSTFVKQPLWTKEYNYVPQASFQGYDGATHIDATADRVAVTGYSEEVDGTFSVQTLVLNASTGETVIPESSLRITMPGMSGTPFGIRFINNGADLMVAANFRNPVNQAPLIVVRVYAVATGNVIGQATYAPSAGVDIPAGGAGMEPDGMCVYITGAQGVAGQPLKLLLARLDTLNAANDWAVLYSIPGASTLSHVGTSLAWARDNNNNTMVAVAGWKGQATGQHTDMLTVLFEGVGGGVVSPRWYAEERHSVSVDENDWATGVLMQPDPNLDEWRVYTTGVVTNGSGDRDWRTLMYKSANQGGSFYPPGSVVKRDFVGPTGNDEPAAMVLSHPGIDRRLYVVGYANWNDAGNIRGDEIYIQKYEDITP